MKYVKLFERFLGEAIEWNDYAEEVFQGEIADVEKDPFAVEWIKSVDGNMLEEDGWMVITFRNGDTLDWKYTFAPHRSREAPGSMRFKVAGKDQGREAMDEFLENYVGGYNSYILAGLYYFIAYKLGILELRNQRPIIDQFIHSGVSLEDFKHGVRGHLNTKKFNI